MRVLIFIFLLFLSGCSIKPEPTEPLVNLRLSSEFKLKKFEMVDKAICVKIVNSVSYANSTKFVYTKQHGVYDKYSYHVWEERLSLMIEKLLIQSIKESNLFKNALSYQSVANYDYLLEVSIDKFEHDVTNKSVVNVWLSFNLIETKTRETISNKTFKISKPTKSVDAIGALMAYDESMGDILEDMLEWLEKIFK